MHSQPSEEHSAVKHLGVRLVASLTFKHKEINIYQYSTLPTRKTGDKA